MIGGNGHSTLLMFKHAPTRVVSLVPSMTDSLFELGAGQAVLGATRYCPIPAEWEGHVTRVGGTREPDVGAIRSLEPELVLANKEENSRKAIEAIESAGIKVWLTFPRTAAEALDVLWLVVRLFRLETSALPTLRTLEVTLGWLDRAAHSQTPARIFCPIWQGARDEDPVWWMTFNQDTYAHDLLRCCGGLNVFAHRKRRYPLLADLGLQDAEQPGERDTRYPHVTLEEIRESDPQVILLPDEPYPFGEEEQAWLMELLAQTSAVKEGRVRPVDGTLITWHGTRMARALTRLPDLLQL